MAQAARMPMCPMAETCKGMMEKPLSSLVMVIPGIAFIALGVLIVVWPSVLPWLVAGACILAGGAMLLIEFHAWGRHPTQTRRRLAAATTLAPSGT